MEGRAVAAGPAVPRADGAVVAAGPPGVRPQAHAGDLRVRLPARDVQPKAPRRWGYYALPVLHGDRLAGKVDPTADREAGVLRVDAVHEDAPFDQATRAAVREEIEHLAQWLELDLALPG